MQNQLLNILAAAFLLTCISCDSSRSVDNQTNNATAPSAATATSDTEVTSDTETSTSATSEMASQSASPDEEFAARATAANMAEVKLGTLAERKGMDQEVVQYGRQMVQDHRNSNSVLMHIARTNKWLTPEEMNAAQQETYTRLEQIERTSFDKEYMATMVRDHEQTIAMFEQASTSVTAQPLKEYIANTLPALRKHLQDARSLQAKLK